MTIEQKPPKQRFSLTPVELNFRVHLVLMKTLKEKNLQEWELKNFADQVDILKWGTGKSICKYIFSCSTHLPHFPLYTPSSPPPQALFKAFAKLSSIMAICSASEECERIFKRHLGNCDLLWEKKCWGGNLY